MLVVQIMLHAAHLFRIVACKDLKFQEEFKKKFEKAVRIEHMKDISERRREGSFPKGFSSYDSRRVPRAEKTAEKD